MEEPWHIKVITMDSRLVEQQLLLLMTYYVRTLGIMIHSPRDIICLSIDSSRLFSGGVNDDDLVLNS